MRAFDLFHFALRPDGYLFLGASETVETADGLFRTLSGPHRVFQRRPSPARSGRALPAMQGRAEPARRHRPVPAGVPPQVGALPSDLHHHLLEAYAPPSAVVDERHDIVHITETAGRFLHVPGGVPTANVVRAVVPELQLELRLALHRAFQQGRATVGGPVRARLAGEDVLVLLIVRPVPGAAGGDGLALVLFAEVEDDVATAVRSDGPAGPLVATLEAELTRARERLQATAEEHETSMEEVRASNEELQSMNEEYRSATEELETGREELQSVNEELETVNGELKARMDELTRVHSDLQHLVTSTEAATLFVDRDLLVQRFTPRVEHLFNIVVGDRGRPLAHITHRLHDIDLTADAAGVLASLMPAEREVKTRDGETYLVRIRPYRTVDDRIEGVVLTFVDVSERVRAEAAMRESEARYRTLFTNIDEGFALCEIVTDAAGAAVDYRFLDANPAFFEMTGFPPDAVGRAVLDLVPDLDPHWIELYARVALDGESVRFVAEVDEMGRVFDIFAAPAEGPGRFTVVFTNITVRRAAEDALAAEARRAAFRVALTDVLRSLADPEAVQEAAARLLGEHLAANRVFYAEAEPDGVHVVARHDYAEGVASFAGRHVLDRFGAMLATELRAGRVVALADVMADTRLSRTEHAAFAAAGIGAAVAVPLVKVGRLAAALAVHQATPRAWTPEEVALVEETAERTWAAVEQTRAEAAVRDSEERLRLIIEGAQEYAFVGTDPDGRIMTWSAGAERIFGWAEAEAVGEMIRTLYTGEDQAGGIPEREMAVAEARGRVLDERWYVRRSGERFWASGTTNVLRDAAGSLRGYAKVLRDNTKRRADEQALLALNETLDARVTERTQALADKTEQARALAGALTLAEQRERNRIAQVLHDHVQQLLFGVQIKLQLLSPDDPVVVARIAGEIGVLVKESLQATRSLTVELSPPVLRGEGLTAALRWLATQMEETHGLRVSVEATGDETGLAEERRMLVFQLVRELLFNVVKHADVDEARVVVEAGPSGITVRVEDDGRGFGGQPTEALGPGGFGLVSLRQRLGPLGGQLSIVSAPGEGTQVTIELPM